MNGRTCYIRQKCQTHRQVKRGRDTKVPQSGGPLKKVGDEAVHKELGDKMERAATTASSLEAELESGNINKTQSMATLNEPNQFWQTIALSIIEDEVMGITATIDRKVKVLVSEASIRRHLKLEDADGIRTLHTAEIFKQLTLMGYHALQNRAFSKAEVRKNMCTYLKNQGGYKMSHFKEMSYEDIRPIFERVWDQINAFIPKDSDIEKEVMKRSRFVQKQPAGEEKEKKKDAESSKQVEEEIKFSNSEEVINVTPLAVKSPIVSWKSYCKGDVGYYEIHRADGSYKTYVFFSEMLNDFDRDDLIMLCRLFNEKYASTRLGFDDLMLWEI
ncbi:hypothetical protein Tco_0179819 [Tanacetum coccineum]